MVVDAGPDFDETDIGPNLCWLTLGQLHRLLLEDNLVNMDARTVLSCLPFLDSDVPEGDLASAVARSSSGRDGGLHTPSEILSWITTNQVTHDIRTTLIPLRDITQWRRSDYAIEHESERYFRLIGVDIQADDREVASWMQPLLEPCGIGVVALLVKRVCGVMHALVNARVEPGFLDVVELAPTVQCNPENYAHLPDENQPPFLDVVLGSSPEQLLFDVELSEEGGRFHQARSRYLIIEVGDEIGAATPADFRWLTLHQITGLLQYSHYLNVQARTLVACLRALG
jgi:oxidase EvaA